MAREAAKKIEHSEGNAGAVLALQPAGTEKIKDKEEREE
jgi:hypothetical protein